MDDLIPQNLITVDEAIAIIDSVQIDRPISIEVDLSRLEEQLTTNVLAQDVIADRLYPPFDKSLLDGFAVRASDVPGSTTLTVVGEIAAGGVSFRPIVAGEAVAIMTGAPVPLGADAVVPVEHTTLNDDGTRVSIDRPTRVGAGIARAGSDCRAGDLVLPAGTTIGPAQLAALATVGASKTLVFGDPITHVLVTGDEIIDQKDEPTGSQMRDAAGPALVSLMKQFSTLPGLSRVKDNRESLRAAIDATASEADVILITGGMSMGRHDYVPAVLRELGFEFLITKLKIKPGKPFVFAVRRRHEKSDFVFGLPGNPVSSYVCAVRLVSRLIARLRGLTPEDGWTLAPLASDIPANGPREFYQPCLLDKLGRATPLAWKGSADVFTLAKADGLICRMADEPAARTGETVRVLRLMR